MRMMHRGHVRPTRAAAPAPQGRPMPHGGRGLMRKHGAVAPPPGALPPVGPAAAAAAPQAPQDAPQTQGGLQIGAQQPGGPQQASAARLAAITNYLGRGA